MDEKKSIWNVNRLTIILKQTQINILSILTFSCKKGGTGISWQSNTLSNHRLRQGFKRSWLCSGKHKSQPNLASQKAANTPCFLKCPKQRCVSLHGDIVMSSFSTETRKRQESVFWSKTKNSLVIQLRLIQKKCNFMCTRCTFLHSCPTARILHVTFKEKSFVWSQQSDFDKLWVCGLSYFPASQESVWLTCMNAYKTVGVPGNSIPLGALQTFPLVWAGPMLSSFSQLKYRPQFWSQEYNYLLLTEFGSETLVLQLAGCVRGRVKIIILCRWNLQQHPDSIDMDQETHLQLPSRKTALPVSSV